MTVNVQLKPENKEEVQELIEHSSEVIGHYWPMTGFIHHNPLHDLIAYPFNEAIRISKRFTGGEGYLPNQDYRDCVKSGRITSEQLDAAIRTISGDDDIEIAGQKISHSEVLRAHLLIGITPPADDTIEAVVDLASNSAQIRSLAKRIAPKVKEKDETQTIGRDMTLVKWCDKTLHKQLEWTMNREVIKWCEAFLDEGHAVWPMPRREQGFYASWKSLAVKEWSPCGIKDSRKKIAALPETPEEAILNHLDGLGIPSELRQEYLSLVLASMHGWASYINWRGSQDFELNSLDWQVNYPIDLAQYLAVRLYYERELVAQTCQLELGIKGTYDAIVSYVHENQKGVDAETLKRARLASAWQLSSLSQTLGLSQKALEQTETEQLDQLLQWLDDFPESEHGPIWLQAYEAGYIDTMAQNLRASASKLYDGARETPKESPRPDSQSIYCIDTRSEPFRRNLEKTGNHETLGYGGFLDTPLRSQAFGQYHITNQNPGIVQPTHTVHEVPRESQKAEETRFKKGQGFLKTIKKMQHDMKNHVFTPYVKVEALGWVFGLPLIGRTLFPVSYNKWRKRVHDAIVPHVKTEITVDRDENGIGFTPEEQAAQCESVFRTMGLTTHTVSRLVVMVGHVSSSDNNPYESAIDCGAAWGNANTINVRLFAAMANKPYNREYMAEQGIVIPEDTHFIAAEHNTTTDEVILFDLEDLPETHKEDIEEFKKAIKVAKVTTNQERCLRLPGAPDDPSPKEANLEVTRRAGDWSETRPEWGLSQNAAYIIGSRRLTKDIDLEGRSFLNSYDYRLDPTDARLERIMNGPLAVGQWINGEHYFSATDPETYGSGSKIYHNVVSRVAVMSGPQSDLRTGLALQTVRDGDKPYHEPLRLLVVAEAPRDRLLRIIGRSDLLTKLFDNQWMHLMAVDPESEDLIYRYIPKQGFEPIPA